MLRLIGIQKHRGLVALIALLSSVGWGVRADVHVFAAASLKTVLDDIGREFESTHGEAIVVTVAGSSALARQIAFGAPADVFISANQAWMDDLENKGRIDAATRLNIAANQLVLIRSAKHTEHPEPFDASRISAEVGKDRIAMALVDAVPAGIYGKAALQSLGAWDTLAPQIVQTDNVRAALALVALGEAPWGIVYASDLLSDSGAKIAARFPEDAHPPIVYPAAVVEDAMSDKAADFVDFLSSEVAQSVFEQGGFVPMRAQK